MPDTQDEYIGSDASPDADLERLLNEEERIAEVYANPPQPEPASERVNHAVIDVILTAALKYKIITNHAATLLGRDLLRMNAASMDQGVHVDAADATHADRYRFRRTPRKVKRVAVDAALRCWAANSTHAPGYRGSQERHLMGLVQERNLHAARTTAEEMRAQGTAEDGTPLYWNFDDVEDAMIRSAAQRAAARQAELRALGLDPDNDDDSTDDEDWDDVDPDFDDDEE